MSKHKDHSCCEGDKKDQLSGKGPDPFIVGIIIFTIVALVGVFYWGTRAGISAEVNSDAKVELVADETSFDWGQIDIEGGKVDHSFAISNNGDAVLKLYDIATSCMCTTAQLVSDTERSRLFGMHEKTSSIFEIAPGQTAQLVVEFDPAYHGPSGVGAISRTVTMSTNDPNHKQLSVRLTGNVFRNE